MTGGRETPPQDCAFTAIDLDLQECQLMSELDAFGQLLMRDVRDRAIRELFGQLQGAGPGPLPEELLRKISAADEAAIRSLISYAADQTIGNFLWYLYTNEDDRKFAMFGPGETNMASLSDGIHTEPFSEQGWIAKYSAFPLQADDAAEEAGDAFK
jgi:hypothetical protein